jgi:Lysine methyltransferase
LSLPGKDVIELGAGCGLVGITAAALGARSVTLTDILNQQSHLAKNIDLNRAMWEKSCCDVNYGVLYFGDSEVGSIPGTGESDRQRKTFEVVLAADIGYDLSLHEPIYRTLVSLLQPLVDNCNMPTGEIYEALNTPRLQSQGIALLAEEVRWSDVHQWYIDCLVGPSEVEHDDYCSQVHMRSLCGGVSCSDGNCDDSCSNQTEVCQVSGSVRNHPPASRMIQKHSTYLTGKAEIASDEVHSLDGVNCRTDKLSTKKSASKKNAIHLVMLTSELIEKNVCANSSSPSSACIEIAAASH